MNSRKNQVFDRTLWPELFDLTFRIASSGHPFEDQRQILSVALRDHTTEQEAGNKFKKLLTRVYINPPPEADSLIQWAIHNPDQFPDRRIMHLGALLGTYPFVGSVAATLGRAFALDSEINGLDLRRRIVGLWGARQMVELGASKTAGMIRKFGIVNGGGLKSMRRGSILEVSGLAAAWLAHALILSRQQESMDAATIADASELFWANLGPLDTNYPGLEVHREGSDRLVYVIRRQDQVRNPN